MTVHERLITTAEFWAIVERPENADKRLELINGVIVEVAPSSNINSILESWIIALLNMFVTPRRLGYVTGPDGGYDLGPHDTVIPDAAFISKARAVGIESKTFPVAPDLAVEVISPSETSRMVMDKVQRYLHAGTQIVWAVYPKKRTVHVYRPDTKMQKVDIDGELDGDPVLPGFTLKVREIFTPLEES